MDREKIKVDFTPEGWFRHGKTSELSGALVMREIISDYDIMQSLFEDESIIHFIGGKNYLDKFSGYEITWDGNHVCDRCGKVLNETASKSVELANAMTVFKGKRIGLCDDCDLALDPSLGRIEKVELGYVVHKTMEEMEIEKLFKKHKMPNDWNRYAWL